MHRKFTLMFCINENCLSFPKNITFLQNQILGLQNSIINQIHHKSALNNIFVSAFLILKGEVQ